MAWCALGTLALSTACTPRPTAAGATFFIFGALSAPISAPAADPDPAHIHPLPGGSEEKAAEDAQTLPYSAHQHNGPKQGGLVEARWRSVAM